MTAQHTSTFVVLDIDKFRPNPFQTRQGEDRDHIYELARSIVEQKASLPDTLGLQQVPVARLAWPQPDRIQPVEVDPSEFRRPGFVQALLFDGEAVAQLAFGHSRLAAFRLLARGPSEDFFPDWVGAEQILPGPDPDYAQMPVRIVQLGDRQMWSMAVEENAARKDINAIEEARSLRQAMEAFGLKTEEAGRPFGYARSTVSNKLRLLDLPQEVQDQIAAGQISEKHGRELLRLLDAPDDLEEVAAGAAELSARELADEVKFRIAENERQADKDRQLAAVAEAFPDIPLHDDDEFHADWSDFREDNYFADRALIEAGVCGLDTCDCFAMRWRSWAPQRSGQVTYARPLPEEAPNVVYVCTDDEVCREKRQALREGTGRGDDGERRLREARERKQAEHRRRETEADRLVDEFLAVRPPAELWLDLEFWRMARGDALYDLDGCDSMADVQDTVARATVRGRNQYTDEAGWAVNVEETRARIERLTPAPVSRETDGDGDLADEEEMLDGFRELGWKFVETDGGWQAIHHSRELATKVVPHERLTAQLYQGRYSEDEYWVDDTLAVPA